MIDALSSDVNDVKGILVEELNLFPEGHPLYNATRAAKLTDGIRKLDRVCESIARLNLGKPIDGSKTDTRRFQNLGRRGFPSDGNTVRTGDRPLPKNKAALDAQVQTVLAEDLDGMGTAGETYNYMRTRFRYANSDKTLGNHLTDMVKRGLLVKFGKPNYALSDEVVDACIRERRKS